MARTFDDSAAEYLSRDSAPVTDAPYTLAAWVNGDTDTNDWMTALFLGDKDNSNQYAAIGVRWQDSPPVAFALTFATTTDTATSSGTVGTSSWHHICGVFAASDDRAAYLDGGNKGTASLDLSPSGADRVGISGSQDSTPGFYWSGSIAEVGIWDVPLTDAEVATLAAGYSPLFVRPQNLVAYWPLIRDEDQDRIGGYDMTAYNTPTVAEHPPVLVPAPIIFLSPPPIGSTVLVIQESSHAHTADNVVLTQAHSLVVQESSHAHTADNAVLTQAHSLVVQESSHAHTADNVVLVFGDALIVQESSHAHTVDNVVLTQAHILLLQDTGHMHLADNVTLSTGVFLIGDITTESLTADITTESLTADITADSLIGNIAGLDV